MKNNFIDFIKKVNKRHNIYWIILLVFFLKFLYNISWISLVLSLIFISISTWTLFNLYKIFVGLVKYLNNDKNYMSKKEWLICFVSLPIFIVTFVLFGEYLIQLKSK